MLERVLAWWSIPEVELAGLFFGVLAACLLLHALLKRVVRRTLRDTSTVRLFLRRTDPPGRVLLPVIGWRVVLESVEFEEAWIASVAHVLTLALIAVLTWFALTVVAGVSELIARRNRIDLTDNLRARRILTQTRVLARTATVLIVVVGIAAALMTFPGARQIGASLLASAGLAGLVAGLAARQVLGNLLAGVQIALTQPIRIDDVLVLEGEWGRVEEITGTYVVVALWDERRLVVPLEYFISKPFQNWTRTDSNILGSVMIWVDYALPVDPLRAELRRIVESAREWDRRICVLQVTDANERAMQLRALVSSADSSLNWDLRCRVREGLIAYVAREHPDALPRLRADARTVADRPPAGAAQ